MKELNHTKGPLTIKRDPHGNDYAILDSEDSIIGESFHQVSGNKFTPAKDNALLFAAAPDMLKCLIEEMEYIISNLPPWRQFGSVKNMLDHLINDCNDKLVVEIGIILNKIDAIEKATGFQIDEILDKTIA